MTRFVNLKKRSVLLPKGCKNLGDLLKGVPPEPAIPIILHHPGTNRPKHHAIEEVKLGDLPRVLLHLFNPEFSRRDIALCSPGDEFMIGLGWNEPKAAVSGSFFLLEDEGQLVAARKLFAGMGKVSGPPPWAAWMFESMAAVPRGLYYEALAGNPLELCSLVQQFFDQVLKWPTEVVLACLVPCRPPSTGPLAGSGSGAEG